MATYRSKNSSRNRISNNRNSSSGKISSSTAKRIQSQINQAASAIGVKLNKNRDGSYSTTETGGGLIGARRGYRPTTPQNETINSDVFNTGNKQVELPQEPQPINYNGTIEGGNASISPGLSQYGITYSNGQFVPSNQTTNTQDSAYSRLQKQFQIAGLEPQKANIYEDPEILRQQKLIERRQQKLNDYTANLNAIMVGAQQQQLALENQGRGITTDILDTQSYEISRRAAIAALPVQAQIATAQGNLELAQSHFETLYKIKSEAINNEYNYQKSLFDSIRDIVNKDEARQLQIIDRDEERRYNEAQAKAKYERDTNISSVTPYESDLDAIIGTVESIIPSKFGQQTFRSQIASARNDSDRLNLVAAQVLKGQSAEARADFRNQAVGISQLDKAIKLIDEGVQTGFLNNTAQYTYNTIGKDFDPKLAQINNLITSAIQPYRNSVTGAAWGEQEDNEYLSLFGSTKYEPSALRQRLVQTKELLKSKSSEGLNAYVNPLGFYDNQFNTGTLKQSNNNENPDDIFNSVVGKDSGGGWISYLWNKLF